MHPEIEIVHRQVRPDVANLLLAGAPHFFHVVEVLLDRGAIGECFQDLLDTRIRIRAEEGIPTMLFLDEHNTNDATHRHVGCQERFVGLGRCLAIDSACGALPSTKSGGSKTCDTLCNLLLEDTPKVRTLLQTVLGDVHVRMKPPTISR